MHVVSENSAMWWAKFAVVKIVMWQLEQSFPVEMFALIARF